VKTAVSRAYSCAVRLLVSVAFHLTRHLIRDQSMKTFGSAYRFAIQPIGRMRQWPSLAIDLSSFERFSLAIRACLLKFCVQRCWSLGIGMVASSSGSLSGVMYGIAPCTRTSFIQMPFSLAQLRASMFALVRWCIIFVFHSHSSALICVWDVPSRLNFASIVFGI